MSEQRFTPTVLEKPKKSHGCLYGCLAATVLVVLMVIGGVFGVRYVAHRLVDAFTDATPMELPVVEVTPDQYEALDRKIEAFKEAVEQDLPAEPLVLSADDINAAIQHDPDRAELKGKVYVTIEDDEVGGMVSLPLGAIRLPFLKGRYFNAAATFTVFLRGGLLHVYVQSAEVKGKAVPEQFMTQLRTENLVKDMQKDPESREMLEKLESIEVRDGMIIITPKVVPEPAPKPTPGADRGATPEAAAEATPEAAQEALPEATP